MKLVFLNVFIKIISIQVRRHNAGDNALSGHYHHCITLQVTLTFAQLRVTVRVTSSGMQSHTFLPSSIPLQWGKP